MADIIVEKLTAEAFAPFGEVIEIDERAEHFPINRGRAERYHDLAPIAFAGADSRPIISIVRSQPYALPLALGLVERHPFGSQAFMPLSVRPFLVVVAGDDGGTPTGLRAFVTAPSQGVNYRINTWHGVLTPLGEEADFLVVDRGGPGSNLEEYHFPEPVVVREG